MAAERTPEHSANPVSTYEHGSFRWAVTPTRHSHECWDPHSGLHFCPASGLSTEPSLQHVDRLIKKTLAVACGGLWSKAEELCLRRSACLWGRGAFCRVGWTRGSHTREERHRWHLSIWSVQSTGRLPHSRTHQTKQLCSSCITLSKAHSHILLLLQISVHPGGRGTARTHLCNWCGI